uniref:Uncharacterized protein n=1 Tax=Rhizophagus irregularis (strain DAOM 181602 / DAOM 197198 / MUCL 43194) TaxID=747089 RepID=U9TFR6_RHIID
MSKHFQVSLLAGFPLVGLPYLQYLKIVPRWIIIQIHSTVKASSNKDLVSCDNVDIQYGHLVNLPWSNSSIGY